MFYRADSMVLPCSLQRHYVLARLRRSGSRLHLCRYVLTHGTAHTAVLRNTYMLPGTVALHPGTNGVLPCTATLHPGTKEGLWKQ